MSITRRIFLRNSALAVVGTAAVPSFLTRAAFGAVERRRAHQASGRDLPTRRRRWPQHRRPSRRAAVLLHAAQHQHSAQVGARSQRLLRTASVALGISAALAAGSSRDRACRRIARHHPLALRRAGFHGDRHSRRKGHRRRMAQPLASRTCQRSTHSISLSRDRARPVGAANLERLRTHRRDE